MQEHISDFSPQEKWNLVLGLEQESSAQDETLAGMERSLSLLYEGQGNKQGGLGQSSPQVNRWLGDIRRYFPASVVQVLQRDALERLGLERMLLEPELLQSMEPDVQLVATLLSLSKLMPARTRETAKMVVQQVVEQVQKRLKLPIQQAMQGAKSRQHRKRKPRFSEIDWARSIRKNLKHYQPQYRRLVLETLVGQGRGQKRNKDLILCVDQSGSMAGSVVNAGILASVLATLPSVHTRFLAFDTSVLDLSAYLDNPVDLLFGTQLGGGTDIAKALKQARQWVLRPEDSLVVLISDLYEGGSPSQMLRELEQLRRLGCRVLVLLSLSDEGTPSYDRQLAEQLANMGLSVMACTPDAFPELLAAQLYGV